MPIAKVKPESLSIILPAKNEADSLQQLLPRLQELYPEAEILVVNDGSTDNTEEICNKTGTRVVSHPYSKGNGAAIKTGARNATKKYLVCMDADGQHSPAEIEKLTELLEQGYDLAVGARKRGDQASHLRWAANAVYNKMASMIVGRRVADLTSGFRACNAAKFREFLHMLPNGFSYPTTSTMAFFRAGYSVGFAPITVNNRQSGNSSHIRLFRDGARFLLIIFRVGTLYSPLKLFLPISALFFLAGIGYYSYTFATVGRFTNGTGLLLITSVLIFLIGLVSEQITHLLYSTHRETPD